MRRAISPLNSTSFGHHVRIIKWRAHWRAYLFELGLFQHALYEFQGNAIGALGPAWVRMRMGRAQNAMALKSTLPAARKASTR